MRNRLCRSVMQKFFARKLELSLPVNRNFFIRRTELLFAFSPINRNFICP